MSRGERGINDEIIPVRLAGEVAVDGLRFEPAGFEGFALHFVQAGVEFFLQLFPFHAVGVFRAPGQAVELVDGSGVGRQFPAASL
jgi:hypothetical protein